MQTIVNSLGISVAASLITLFLLWVSRTIWKYRLEKLFLQLSNRTTQDISGEWYAQFKLEDGTECKDDVILYQHGYRIEGKSYFVRTHPSGAVTTKVYDIVGTIKNDLFCAYYLNTSRRQKGAGSLTYRIEEDGYTLRGYGVYYDEDDNEIKTGPYKLAYKDFTNKEIEPRR